MVKRCVRARSKDLNLDTRAAALHACMSVCVYARDRPSAVRLSLRCIAMFSSLSPLASLPGSSPTSAIPAAVAAAAAAVLVLLAPSPASFCSRPPALALSLSAHSLWGTDCGFGAATARRAFAFARASAARRSQSCLLCRTCGGCGGRRSPACHTSGSRPLALSMQSACIAEASRVARCVGGGLLLLRALRTGSCALSLSRLTNARLLLAFAQLLSSHCPACKTRGKSEKFFFLLFSLCSLMIAAAAAAAPALAARSPPPPPLSLAS